MININKVRTSDLPLIKGNEITSNDIVQVSHALNGVPPYEYESRSITFKELCIAIAKQLKWNGDIPYGDE